MELVKDVLLTLTFAKAPEVFSVRSISGGEELGALYEYHVELTTELPEVDVRSFLGQPMTVHVDLGDNDFRHLSGVVSKIRRGENDFEDTVYHVTLRPEQHKLSYRHNCRIFQDTTVVDVVKALFAEHGLRSVRESLFEQYRKWDYLTQYRESDLEFMRRILALEGIYFYFDHLPDGHQLVLADSISSHSERDGFGSVPLSRAREIVDSSDCLTWWSETYELATQAVSVRDFDFRHRGPSAVLKAEKGSGAKEQDAKAERYEYPGIIALHENETNTSEEAKILKGELAEGERLSSVRLEEKQSKVECYEAEGNARCLQVGSLFAVSTTPALAGRQFLIVSTEVTFRNPLRLGQGGNSIDDRSYVRLTAIDSKTQFRMPRIEKPVVLGAQTARVVGAKDDEIMTDKYGRVKVKFHWDRKENTAEEPEEKSSCWVRVAHPWAGSKWGAIHIPRVGNEVVVQFMDGDPDRPLVMGGVYNVGNMPPYDLPDNKTQSGIKSRSSKGGTENNFNEIRFEDLKGKEELHIQAERDMSTLVKRNQSTSVGADRSVSVGGNHSVSVTGTQSTTVTKDETQTYKANRKMTVTGTNTDEVTGKHKGTYHAGRTETVEKGDTLTVEGSNKTITVHGEYNSIADTQFKVTNGTNIIFMKGSDIVVNNSGCEIQLSGSETTVTAKASVAIKCGSSSISLKSDGTIEITGVKLKIGNANNNAAFEPAGTTINGVKITSASVGMHEISGALIKVG
jgi:type VI secretion system secreted protein VgrG